MIPWRNIKFNENHFYCCDACPVAAVTDGDEDKKDSLV